MEIHFKFGGGIYANSVRNIVWISNHCNAEWSLVHQTVMEGGYLINVEVDPII